MADAYPSTGVGVVLTFENGDVEYAQGFKVSYTAEVTPVRQLGEQEVAGFAPAFKMVQGAFTIADIKGSAIGDYLDTRDGITTASPTGKSFSIRPVTTDGPGYTITDCVVVTVEPQGSVDGQLVTTQVTFLGRKFKQDS